MDIQFFGGRGGKSNKKQQTQATTPSGVSYEQFMQMSDDNKYNLMVKIINDNNVKVPDYLDNSITTKIIYSLGMNTKPTVVSDSDLDKLPGKDLYRAFYDNSNFNISSKDIADQLKYGDYTQLSGKGGSVYGRGIYFSENDFIDAADYGSYGDNILVMRAKINSNAKMSTLNKIQNKIEKDSSFRKTFTSFNEEDRPTLYAIAHGIDGWSANAGYPSIYGGQPVIHIAMINRKALTFSSINKSDLNKDGSGFSSSWSNAKDF